LEQFLFNRVHEVCKKPDLTVQATKFVPKKIFPDHLSGVKTAAVFPSLACKSTFSPFAVTVVAAQLIMLKYRTRIMASISGENAFPKDDKRLGTGRTLISPCK
jgi:hypothetical protein